MFLRRGFYDVPVHSGSGLSWAWALPVSYGLEGLASIIITPPGFRIYRRAPCLCYKAYAVRSPYPYRMTKLISILREIQLFMYLCMHVRVSGCPAGLRMHARGSGCSSDPPPPHERLIFSSRAFGTAVVLDQPKFLVISGLSKHFGWIRPGRSNGCVIIFFFAIIRCYTRIWN
jgi:hypothetical protein